MNRWQRYRLKDLPGYRQRKREYARTPAQRAKRNAYQKKWYYANHAKSLALAHKYYHASKHKYKERDRAANLWRQYGITLAQYDEMLTRQGGTCAICKKPPKVKRLHVDHCHSTGRVRGLLCGSCNGRLGWLEMFREAISAYPI